MTLPDVGRCPPIRVYDAEHLDAQLRMATQTYLDSEVIMSLVVFTGRHRNLWQVSFFTSSSGTTTAVLPRIFAWFVQSKIWCFI